MKKLNLLLLLLTFGCTDAEITKYTTFGSRGEIICNSGGKVTFHGISTGKVMNERNSDGYYAKWEIVKAPGYLHVKKGDIKPATLSSDCNLIYIK